MRSKTLGLLIVIVMVVLLGVPVGAAPAPDRTAPAPDTGELGVYIVRFEGASLASYEGGIAGLEATSPAATGEAKLDVKSAASVAYLDYLANWHAQFVAAMERTLDRSVEVLFRYDVVLNGMAVRMTGAEAAQVATLPGIVDVQLETIEYPTTDVGPTWIGAPGIWDGSAVPGGVGTKGEGVIVGVIDTGINSDHPSFADVGGDGYDHTNPWGAGTYVGHCVANPTFCNDKLIGAWNFAGDGPEDTDGHGSHTSSTAAGNVYNATKTTPTGFVVNTQISGVAPHANIIMYDACVTSCAGSALLASAQQALVDGVDAINYSISGGNNPYGDSVELVFLDLNTAGVFVSTSAGNNGPGAATVAHRSPWVSTVAAATHNRLYTNELINMTGGATTPPADILGQSISTGYGPAPIVYAGNYGDPLCGTPFAPGTWTNQIVVCDRGGGYGRVDKGANVLAGGADGYILANDAASGNSLVADPHVLPAIHITYDDGVVLKAWLASGSGHTGTITTTSTDLDPNNGDIMASFSSRGPNTTFDVLKPDMSTPGVAVFAAYRNGIELEWLGGTSMASPHNAGAGALMKALYPSWSPTEIKSAIMTTAWTQNLRKEDGVTPADPFDVGAGRDNLLAAAKAGIVLDESRANYLAANPATGGDPKTLNMPSLQNINCGGACSWTRTVKSTQSSAVDWTVAGTGMGFTFTPQTFTLAAGATQEIVITADVTGLPLDVWAFGEVTLTPDDASIPEAHLPVAVIPTQAVPAISVEPGSFDTTQQVDTAVTHPLVVSNDGTAPLDWSIFEEAGVLGGEVMVDWFDNFDSYATDLLLQGVGGWKGWGNDPAAAAYTRDEQARSTPNSVEIVNLNDAVHEYSGYTSGTWIYTAWQYIPTGSTGESYFILLNQYDDAAASNNWSVQVNFNSNTSQVINTGFSGGTLPLVRGQWMEIRVEIDLDSDTQSFYYGGSLLYQGTWTGEVSGGGIANIAAVDLWGNGASAVYYDDMSLVAGAATCSTPSEIPWVSVDPTSGTTPEGESSMVDVTFDTTGLTVGNTYNGNLCVESNDPVRPLVVVPLELTVVADGPAITVDPTSLDSTQYADMVEVLELTICNVGDAALAWSLTETETVGVQVSPQVLPAETSPRVERTVELSLDAAPVPGGSVNTAPPATNAPVSLVLDDGSVENNIGIGGTWEFIFLNRFTPDPGAYPFYLNEIQVYFDSTGLAQVGDDIILVVYENTTGNTDPAVGSNWLASFPTTVQALNAWNVWNLATPVLLNGPGDVLIGVIALEVPGTSYWPAAIDQTATQQRSWAGWWLTAPPPTPPTLPPDDSWILIDAYFPGNWMVRGYGETSTGFDVPWLSEDPIGGILEPGLCEVVDVSFDSTGLTPGDYFGDLLVTSNDPINPEVTVPVTLTVLQGMPNVVVDPLALEARVCADATEVLTLTVCNTGTAPVDWSLSEQPPALLALPQVALPPALSDPDSVVDLVGGAEPAAPAPDGSGVIWDYPEAVLYDNGPLVTHPAACAGMDASRLQTDLLMNTLGFGNQYLVGNHMADDFEVTGDGWQVDQITFFAYQTGAPSSPSPITGVYYQIWDGPPNDPASSVVWGDLTTNRLLSSASPNMQRDSVSTPCANNRYIFANVASAGASLPPGTYWLDWMTDGSLASGPWAPPVTILGQTTTGNAMQYTSTGWAPANDTGTLTQQGMPFIVEGEPLVLFDIPWLSEDPTAGTVQPGECQEVAVTFDATGMTPGDYAGALLIESNDPDTPEITIPVNMTIPEPAAIAGVTYVVDGLEVTFDATVSGTAPIAFAWDFGDGNTSDVEDPVHVYEAGGDYTVTLIVSNDCGEDTWTAQISVCDPVSGLDFSWLPAMPAVNDEILFTATAMGTPPITFAWDFGDGTTGAGITATHAYTMAGDYVVTLTATNCDGTGSAVITDTVTVAEAPVTMWRVFLPVVMKGNQP